MNLSYDLLPPSLYWMSHIAFAVLMGIAFYTAPWKRFRKSEQLHVFLGSAVILLLVWSLKAGINPGLNYHLLGGTLFALMFGWQFALIGVSLVLCGYIFNSGGEWATFSLNALLMGAIPVLLSSLVLHLAIRHLPHHFFVYVMVNAYFCGGLAMAITVGTAAGLLLGFEAYSFSELVDGYLPFAPFMIFAEGFFTGMLAASMALMRPDWIWTFDEGRYITGK